MNDPHTQNLKQARKRLMQALNRKPLTIEEARKKLIKADFDSDIIDEVLKDAEERNWLDDESYAKLWVADRISHNPRGKALISTELKRKGVGQDEIDTAIDESDINEESMIAELIERKRFQYDQLDPKTRERRIIGMLKRRGFSFGAIRNAMDKLREEND